MGVSTTVDIFRHLQRCKTKNKISIDGNFIKKRYLLKTTVKSSVKGTPSPLTFISKKG